jgi:hypothetical protein
MAFYARLTGQGHCSENSCARLNVDDKGACSAGWGSESIAGSDCRQNRLPRLTPGLCFSRWFLPTPAMQRSQSEPGLHLAFPTPGVVADVESSTSRVGLFLFVVLFFFVGSFAHCFS